MALLLAFHCAVYARLIFQAIGSGPYLALKWDFASQYYPWISYAADGLRAGRLPLWCPFVAGGTPFFLNPQSQLYFPGTWLMAAIGGYSPYTAQLQCLATVLFGAVGAYCLSSALWSSRLAAMVTALGFDATAAVYSNLEHMTYINSYALMPWLFWLIYQAVERERSW
ncbi:MAG: hypothetical protein KGR26_06955, partial [Cyanobacteria bacterium REEB65]|nr:hypothetical protein [Cyanobacteria bacterium REEB65]